MGLAPVISNPARPLPRTSPVNTVRQDYEGDLNMNLKIIGDPGAGRERLCRQLAENDLNDLSPNKRRVYYFTTSPVSNGLAALFDVVLIGSKGNFPIVQGEGRLLAEAAIAAQASAVIDLGGVEHHIAAGIIEGFIARISKERDTPMTIYFENADASLRRKRNRDNSAISAVKTGLASGFASVGGADMRFVICTVSANEIPLELDALIFDVVATKLSSPRHIDSLAYLVSAPELAANKEIGSLGLRFLKEEEYWIWAFTKGLEHLPLHFRLDDALTPAGRGNTFDNPDEKNEVEKNFENKLEDARRKDEADKKEAEVTTAVKRSEIAALREMTKRKAKVTVTMGRSAVKTSTSTATTMSERKRALLSTGMTYEIHRRGIARISLNMKIDGSVRSETVHTTEATIAEMANPEFGTAGAWIASCYRLKSVPPISAVLAGYAYATASAKGIADVDAFFADLRDAGPKTATVRAALMACKADMISQERLLIIADALGMDVRSDEKTAANDDETLGNAA